MAKKKNISQLEKFRNRIAELKKEIRKNVLDFPDFYDPNVYNTIEEDPAYILESMTAKLMFLTEINSNYEKYLIRGNIKMKTISNDIGSRRSQKAITDVICSFIENSKLDYTNAKNEFNKNLKNVSETYPKIKAEETVDEITEYVHAADFIWSGEYEQI
jgi:predicted translin family RNA/ssDNA-binding protein